MSAKSPDAFRTISEVAEWLDRPAHVLRFWESKFNQIKPVKRAGGRRYYRPEDMLLLGGIKKLLHDDGMTIKGVQKMLRENGVRHVSAMSQPLDDDGMTTILEASAADATPPMEDAHGGAVVLDAVALEPVAEVEVVEPATVEDPEEEDTLIAAPVKIADPVTKVAPVAPPVTLELDLIPPVPKAAPVPPTTPVQPKQDQAKQDQAAQDQAKPDLAEPPQPEVVRPPLGANLPPPPDLAAITPTPGPLSRIAAFQGPIPAPARDRIASILPQLDAMIARLGTARR